MESARCQLVARKVSERHPKVCHMVSERCQIVSKGKLLCQEGVRWFQIALEGCKMISVKCQVGVT